MPLTIDASIPQHPLKDGKGRNTDFHFSPWGQKIQSYNIEKTHRHNFHEILFFQKGGAYHDIDFTTWKAHKGSVHFVAPDNVHLLLRSPASEGCSLLFISSYIGNNLLRQLPFNTGKPVLNPDAANYRRIRGLLAEIAEEYLNENTSFREIIHAQMLVLLHLLLRIYRDEQPEIPHNDKRPELLLRFLDLLEKNFLQHFTVGHYAELLHTSGKHLIELCRTHTGKTPLKLIQEHMLSEAKKLLYHSNVPVKEIAYSLRFDDPANFSRYFKSLSGYSPQDYRKGIRGKNDT